MSKPKVGDIAICNDGVIGLITQRCIRAGTFVGVTLEEQGNPSKDNFRFRGAKWQSKKPLVIGNMDDILKKLKKKARQGV